VTERKIVRMEKITVTVTVTVLQMWGQPRGWKKTERQIYDVLEIHGWNKFHMTQRKCQK
jgi:hypothetical protein